MKTFLSFFLIMCAFSMLAQEKIHLKDLKGEWVLSNDITPIQAREKAIDQAKVEALRQAGLPELVSESNVMFKAESKEKMKELFESLVSVSVSGEIWDFEVVREEKKLLENGTILYQVWINASVIFHKGSKDEGFNFEVNGISDTFKSPDKLTFNIKPWKDGYLSAFILSEKESGQLFPNRLERSYKLNAGASYSFPGTKALDYEVTTESQAELNYLVLLFTKVEIPFREEESSQNILHFISSIEPSQKCVKGFALLIKK